MAKVVGHHVRQLDRLAVLARGRLVLRLLQRPASAVPFGLPATVVEGFTLLHREEPFLRGPCGKMREERVGNDLTDRDRTPGLAGLRRFDQAGLQPLPLDTDGAALEVDVRNLEAQQLAYAQS